MFVFSSFFLFFFFVKQSIDPLTARVGALESLDLPALIHRVSDMDLRSRRHMSMVTACFKLTVFTTLL